MYNASDVVSLCVFQRSRKLFCFQNALGYSRRFKFFYSAGVVTHDRRIGSWVDYRQDDTEEKFFL
jgi:hypothetical protein